MKIVVTAQGETLDAQVDPRFGRAAMFLLIDTDSDRFEVHDNQQNLNAAQGAGIQAAQNVAALGAEAVVTGHVGPKAFATLQAAGVAVYSGASGMVRDAVESLRRNKIQPAASADVEGHWA